LDFLGFSRPNRDLSMGCARFSAKRISQALSWFVAPEERRKLWREEDRSWVHPIAASDFLQEIVVNIDAPDAAGCLRPHHFQKGRAERRSPKNRPVFPARV
jgi:hypothetical protein